MITCSLSKKLFQWLFLISSFLYSCNAFFKLTYLLFDVIKTLHLFHLNDKWWQGGKNTLQQKIPAMLFSLLISYYKDEVRDLHIQPRLFITLHKIPFTCESLFQLQSWNSAGFNHFFNHLDQNRNFPSYEKFSICSLIIHLYYKQRKGFFKCWKSNLWKMRKISFTKMDFNKWGFICFITYPYLIFFI